MSEEKNVLEEVVSAIQKLLGFGSTEDITGTVNAIVDAQGDEAGILGALQGLFGDAIEKADLLSVVQGFLGKGGIDLGNILDVFQGIGDKVGGFDKVAGLMGLAANAGGIVDAVGNLAGSVSDAAKDSLGKGADLAGAAVDSAVEAAGAAGEVAKDAAGAVVGAAGAAAGAVGGGVRGAVGKVSDAAGAVAEEVKQVAAEPANKRKKWPVVLGVVVVVVALAGIGFWNWHNQPSFCNAFCHTSMDAYVQTYVDQEDNAAGVDKYGNTVANTHAMLSISHKSHNLACLDCHIPAIDQQIGEVVETITGNYIVYERVDGSGYALPEVDLADLQVNAHLANDSGKGDEFCLREGCHNFTREQLAAATESYEFNPHRAQHGEIACGECHKSHRASVFYCTQCHSEAAKAMPEGWLTYQEGKDAIPS